MTRLNRIVSDQDVGYGFDMHNQPVCVVNYHDMGVWTSLVVLYSLVGGELARGPPAPHPVAGLLWSSCLHPIPMRVWCLYPTSWQVW